MVILCSFFKVVGSKKKNKQTVETKFTVPCAAPSLYRAPTRGRGPQFEEQPSNAIVNEQIIILG